MNTQKLKIINKITYKLDKNNVKHSMQSAKSVYINLNDCCGGLLNKKYRRKWQ